MRARLGRSVYVVIITAASLVAGTVPARAADPVVKVAFWNIMSGKGVTALPGYNGTFINTSNCTDPTQPLNAWGVGASQAALQQALSDPSVVALGLAEAWNCGGNENVRQALGWKAHTSEENGVTLIARYGIAGPEQWKQLDTSLNTNPADTMWVLRVPVCLDAACSQSLLVYVSHWYGTGTYARTSYNRQAQQTADFLTATSSGLPHVLVGDLNTWEGTSAVCNQNPNNTSLSYLRGAGYYDAWLTIHGSAEGYTGMADRAGCGNPEGYTWKRIDYEWSLPSYQPIDIQRWGMQPPGDASPSDHYGILATYPWPGTVPSATATSTTPTTTTTTSSTSTSTTSTTTTTSTSSTSSTASTSTGDIVLYAKRARNITGAWTLVSDATAAGGTRIWNPDQGAAKITTPSATPASYFELPFAPKAGVAYRLWVRGRAQNDSWANDSIYVQFSGSLTSAGATVFRIGTTSATTVNLEEASNVGVSGWGWQDNGYGLDVLGTPIFFDGTPQTLRVQVREDGFSIDQIVLSPVTYMTAAPGTTKNDTTILPETTAPTVTWASSVNVTVNLPGVTKTSGCDGCPDAAVTGRTAITNTDAYFQFTPMQGGRMVLGLLPDGSSATDFRAMPYTFGFWQDGSWDVRELGVWKADGAGQPGDLFTIAVQGGVARFYRNGTLVYTSALPATGMTLKADGVLFSSNASVSAPRADVTLGSFGK